MVVSKGKTRANERRTVSLAKTRSGYTDRLKRILRVHVGDIPLVAINIILITITKSILSGDEPRLRSKVFVVSYFGSRGSRMEPAMT